MNNLSDLDTTGFGKSFHITIGAFPSSKLSLDQEVRLIKSAILYADQVKLYSLKASMLSMIRRVGELSFRQQLYMIEKIAPYIKNEADAKELIDGLNMYRKFVQRKHRGRYEILKERQFAKVMNEQWVRVEAIALKMAQDAGIESIDKAVKSGLLELHTFDGTDRKDVIAEFITDCVIKASKSPLLTERDLDLSQHDDQWTNEFVKGVSQAVSDGATYPLFDEQTGSLVRAGIREEKITISDSAVRRARHAGLAGHVLEILPLFDQASIDEILNIRRELDKPLVRFRSAMMRFSDQIRSASWEKDFPSEAEMVFHREVRPALLDIEESIKSNKYILSLLRKVVDKPLVLPSGSILALALSNTSSLPHEIAFTLGVSASVSALIFDAYQEWKQKNQVVEQNALFFYYQAQKRLKKISKK